MANNNITNIMLTRSIRHLTLTYGLHWALLSNSLSSEIGVNHINVNAKKMDRNSIHDYMMSARERERQERDRVTRGVSVPNLNFSDSLHNNSSSNSFSTSTSNPNPFTGRSGSNRSHVTAGESRSARDVDSNRSISDMLSSISMAGFGGPDNHNASSSSSSARGSGSQENPFTHRHYHGPSSSRGHSGGPHSQSHPTTSTYNDDMLSHRAAAHTARSSSGSGENIYSSRGSSRNTQSHTSTPQITTRGEIANNRTNSRSNNIAPEIVTATSQRFHNFLQGLVIPDETPHNHYRPYAGALTARATTNSSHNDSLNRSDTNRSFNDIESSSNLNRSDLNSTEIIENLLAGTNSGTARPQSCPPVTTPPATTAKSEPKSKSNPLPPLPPLPECPICLEKFDETDHIPMVLSRCGHTYCNTCLREDIRGTNGRNYRCPSCRVENPMDGSVAQGRRNMVKNFSLDSAMKVIETYEEREGRLREEAQNAQTMAQTAVQNAVNEVRDSHNSELRNVQEELQLETALVTSQRDFLGEELKKLEDGMKIMKEEMQMKDQALKEVTANERNNSGNRSGSSTVLRRPIATRQRSSSSEDNRSNSVSSSTNYGLTVTEGPSSSSSSSQPSERPSSSLSYDGINTSTSQYNQPDDEEIAALKEKLSLAEAIADRHKEQAQTYEHLSEAKHHKLLKEEVRAQDLSEQLNITRGDIQAMKANAERASRKNAKLSSDSLLKIQELEDRNRDLEQQNTAKENRVRTLQTENETFQQINSDLHRKDRDAQRRDQNFTRKIEDQRNELQGLQESLQRSNELMHNEAQTLHSLTSDYQEQKLKNEHLESQCALLSYKIAQQAEENHQQKAQTNSLLEAESSGNHLALQQQRTDLENQQNELIAALNREHEAQMSIKNEAHSLALARVNTIAQAAELEKSRIQELMNAEKQAVRDELNTVRAEMRSVQEEAMQVELDKERNKVKAETIQLQKDEISNEMKQLSSEQKKVWREKTIVEIKQNEIADNRNALTKVLKQLKDLHQVIAIDNQGQPQSSQMESQSSHSAGNNLSTGNSLTLSSDTASSIVGSLESLKMSLTSLNDYVLPLDSARGENGMNATQSNRESASASSSSTTTNVKQTLNGNGNASTSGAASSFNVSLQPQDIEQKPIIQNSPPSSPAQITLSANNPYNTQSPTKGNAKKREKRLSRTSNAASTSASAPDIVDITVPLHAPRGKRPSMMMIPTTNTNSTQDVNVNETRDQSRPSNSTSSTSTTKLNVTKQLKKDLGIPVQVSASSSTHNTPRGSKTHRESSNLAATSMLHRSEVQGPFSARSCSCTTAGNNIVAPTGPVFRDTETMISNGTMPVPKQTPRAIKLPQSNLGKDLSIPLLNMSAVLNQNQNRSSMNANGTSTSNSHSPLPSDRSSARQSYSHRSPPGGPGSNSYANGNPSHNTASAPDLHSTNSAVPRLRLPQGSPRYNDADSLLSARSGGNRSARSATDISMTSMMSARARGVHEMFSARGSMSGSGSQSGQQSSGTPRNNSPWRV